MWLRKRPKIGVLCHEIPSTVGHFLTLICRGIPRKPVSLLIVLIGGMFAFVSSNRLSTQHVIKVRFTQNKKHES